MKWNLKCCLASLLSLGLISSITIPYVDQWQKSTYALSNSSETDENLQKNTDVVTDLIFNNFSYNEQTKTITSTTTLEGQTYTLEINNCGYVANPDIDNNPEIGDQVFELGRAEDVEKTYTLDLTNIRTGCSIPEHCNIWFKRYGTVGKVFCGFFAAKNLKKVIFPERSMFYGGAGEESEFNSYGYFQASGLEQIVFPRLLFDENLSNTNKQLHYQMFAYCSNLQNVDLSNVGNIYLINTSFRSCTSLVSVLLPQSLNIIGTWSFSNCSSLEYINIPCPINIAGVCFNGCTSENLKIKIEANDLDDVPKFHRLENLGDTRIVFLFNSEEIKNKFVEVNPFLAKYVLLTPNKDISIKKIGLQEDEEINLAYNYYSVIPDIKLQVDNLQENQNPAFYWKVELTSGEKSPFQINNGKDYLDANEVAVGQVSIGQLTAATLNNHYDCLITAISSSDPTITATTRIVINVYATPGSITISGQENLTGIKNVAGSASYTLTTYPEDACKLASWQLLNSTAGISINDQGVLSWTNSLNVGTYNITIKATADRLITRYPENITSSTKTVKLTITNTPPTSITINGNDTLNTTKGTQGSSNYTITPTPSNANGSVTWSLENNSQGNKISINQSGVLSWTNTLDVGTYNFTIKATSIADTSIIANKNVTLTIAYANPILDNISLTGDGVNGSNINLTYNQSTNITASCSITNENNVDPSLAKSWSMNNAPAGASINSNGQLTVPTTQILNNVSFSIIYQVGTVRQTLSVSLTISYASPVLGEITLTKASGDATITGNIINQVYGNASTFNASCNITNNANIDPNLAKTWSINNAPSGVSINASSGLITFSNTTAKVSNHAFSVTYTVGTITKTQNYTLNVGYATPVFSDITLQGTGVVDNTNINLSLNQAATINASCNVTNPNNIDPSLTKSWAMQNQPAGVTINSNTGAISIPNNLAIGNYTFTLTYQCGTYKKQSTITLSIGYETPILSNITLSSANNVTIQGSNVSIDYHTSGSFQATCDVTNQPNINPSLTKTWSLANAPSGVSINNNGLVTIAIDMNKVTNQAITINCNIGGVSKTLIFRLTINYQQPQLDGQITLMHEGIALNGNLNLTYQTQADIQASCQINNPNNIDPNLNKTWSLQNAPSGISINNIGMIHVADNLNVGSYTINVIYQVGSQSSTTTFNLNIEYAMINNITISGSQSLQGFQNTAGSSNYQASINPLNANPNVTWILNNAPSSISIDNQGILTWNALLPGTYNFSIIATSVTDPSISQSYDVSLYIQEAPAPVSKTTDSVYAIVWGTSAGVLAIGLISIVAYQIHKYKKISKMLD